MFCFFSATGSRTYAGVHADTLGGCGTSHTSLPCAGSGPTAVASDADTVMSSPPGPSFQTSGEVWVRCPAERISELSDASMCSTRTRSGRAAPKFVRNSARRICC